MILTNFEDAKAVTSATSGKVLSLQTVSLGALTAAQKTVLVNLIGSFAGWTGNPAYVLSLIFARTPGTPANITASMTGVIVHPDANTALAARGSLDDILGVVP